MIKNLYRHFIFYFKQRITELEFLIYLQQFSTLITAGISLIQCIETLEKSQKKLPLIILCAELKYDLFAGKKLSEAMRRHHFFHDYLCDLIFIGEQTGKLDDMMKVVANHKAQGFSFKQKIKKALFYPALIIITATAVTSFMFIFIIPSFANLFQDKLNELPLFSRMIFTAAKIISHNMPFIFITFLIFIIINVYCFLQIHIRKKIVEIFFQLPLIRVIYKKILLTRYLHFLATSLAAGIPLFEALNFTAKACPHLVLKHHTAILRSRIAAGIKLHQAMDNIAYFPKLLVQMIKIGEESGKLDFMLDKIVTIYENDTVQFLERLNQLLEPLIMLVLGVLIGGLVIGMYLPIFKLGSAL